jgi:hypothetical protein
VAMPEVSTGTEGKNWADGSKRILPSDSGQFFIFYRGKIRRQDFTVGKISLDKLEIKH